MFKCYECEFCYRKDNKWFCEYKNNIKINQFQDICNTFLYSVPPYSCSLAKKILKDKNKDRLN